MLWGRSQESHRPTSPALKGGKEKQILFTMDEGNRGIRAGRKGQQPVRLCGCPGKSEGNASCDRRNFSYTEEKRELRTIEEHIVGAGGEKKKG